MEKIQHLFMHDVTRNFGTTTALQRFNLEIRGGEFVTLLGPSGCGKSTALNCLAGLLDLSSGEILLNGRPIQHVSAEKRGFGMVFQNYALFPHLNATRNVGYGLEVRGVKRAERERRVQHALDLVQLGSYGKRYPAQLSGGQQQRLAIARTIVLEPALLLLDEPLSNLDANLRNEMRIEIKRLHNELGLTTLYVTHDQSEAMSLSDIVVVMRQGHIEQIGTPQTVYTHPGSLFVAHFMGYVNRLAVTLERKEGEVWAVRTTNGVILRATPPSGQDVNWQPGQSVIACARPDELQVDVATDVNRLSGHVDLVEYVGRAFEILVRMEQKGQEDPQKLLVYSPQPPVPTEMVEFGINPGRLLLFPCDEDHVGMTDSIQTPASSGGTMIQAQR